MSVNLYEISRLVNGGHYVEVETYQKLKGEKKNTTDQKSKSLIKRII